MEAVPRSSQNTVQLAPEQQSCQKGKEIRDLLRIATLVSVVAAVFSFILFPNPLTICMVPFTAYASYEIFNMMTNIDEIPGRQERARDLDKVFQGAPVLQTLFLAAKINVANATIFH